MADRTVKECDVYRTMSEGTARFAASLHGPEDDDGGQGPAILILEADLSPRAARRAEHLIRKAFTSAKRKGGDDAGES